jgi:hypothetical protein
MPIQIPFTSASANYRLITPIDGVSYIFDTRWNGFDQAWYVDILEEDETPIATSIKLVLGCYLGKLVTHSLFRTGVFVVIDTSGQRQEATIDDLGARVQVRRYTVPEVFGPEGEIQ